MSDSLPISIVQTAPRLGATDANVRELAAHAGGGGLLVTPELSLTGYDLRDRTAEVALTADEAAACVRELGSIVVGFPERAPDGAVYNAAAHIGGYLAVMTATYPADLTADLTAVLSRSR